MKAWFCDITEMNEGNGGKPELEANAFDLQQNCQLPILRTAMVCYKRFGSLIHVRVTSLVTWTFAMNLRLYGR